MRCSLIIATKGRPEPLSAVLDSAGRGMPADGEVIVVDGDPERSAESVVSDLRSRFADLMIRYVASDPGAALQRNLGIDAASGDIVVFLDDDCTFEPGLFEALLTAYEDPEVVGVTGRIEQPPRERVAENPHSRLRLLLVGGGRQGTVTGIGFRRPIIDRAQARDVEFMPGPLMSARREIAAEVRFDERLTAYSLGEDDDFSYRVSRRGRMRYEPSALVYHHELGWRSMDRRRMDCLQVVNRSYLFRKNFSPTLRTRAAFWRLIVLLFGHRVLNREWSGLRGLLQGVRLVLRFRRLEPAAALAQAQGAMARADRR